MIKQAKRAIAVLSLVTFVGCSNTQPSATPPLTNVTPIALYQTQATAPLADIISREYAESGQAIPVQSQSVGYVDILNNIIERPSTLALSSLLPDDNPLWAAPVARDGMAIIVHPSNPIMTLSIDEVQRIYRGNTQHWSDITGIEGDIMLLSRERGSEMHRQFERLVMGQQRMTPTVQVLPSTEAIIRRVADSVTALSYVPISELTSDVKAIAIETIPPTKQTITDSTYPLRYTIYILADSEPLDANRQFVAWIQSARGQTAIHQRYAPLP